MIREKMKRNRVLVDIYEAIMGPIHNIKFAWDKKHEIKKKYYQSNIGYPYRGYEAMQALLQNFEFESVLDVGCGEGIHSEIFLENNKIVTAIDYGNSIYFRKRKDNPQIKCIIGDFNNYTFDQKFDCVWCCHVLEHQLSPQDFLIKLLSLVNEDGIICLTVPPYKSEIVGGHVNLFNAGILLYRLVLAGCDCSAAHIKTYDYDVSVIVQKKTINVIDEITYDAGDLKKIHKYLPEKLTFYPNDKDIPFEGNIASVNWRF